MQNILLLAIYGHGLEPFGGAKTGRLIASIDSPPDEEDLTILVTERGHLAFVHLNFVILTSGTLSSFSSQKRSNKRSNKCPFLENLRN